jgi:predicted AAA+ superfamily ATPase
MAEIQSGSTGLSGEYFVAAELLRRGFSVGITMGNAKAIDILAEKNDKQFIIQVKAIYKKKNVGWPMMKDKVMTNHFYVFVNLNGDKMGEPEYFICTGKQAKDKVKQYTTRGIVDLSSLNSDDFKGRWDKIK